MTLEEMTADRDRWRDDARRWGNENQRLRYVHQAFLKAAQAVLDALPPQQELEL